MILSAHYVLTGRYGAKAPQDSATNNLLSGYLWLIFRGREQHLEGGKKRVERDSAAEVERRREVDWRAATAEWKQLMYHQHADPVETAMGLSCQPLNCR